jgi:hypothetical protein
MPAGQPTKYNQKISDEICELVATTSKSMKTICKMVGISYQTHLNWIRTTPEYFDQYARAKEDQSDLLIEEMIDIADDSSGDEKVTADGVVKMDSEYVQRSRIRIDTRKWIASKLKPKKYGDKVDVTSDGDKIQTPVIDMSKWR